MERARRTSGDEGKIDIGGEHAGELDLSLFGRLNKALGAHLIGRKVNSVLTLELSDHPVNDAVVEIITAQVGIAIGSFNFKHAVTQLKDGHIERTAAKVEYENGLFFINLVKPVSKRCRGRLVDDTKDFQTGNLTGILGCLTLAVVKVCRNGDNRLADRLSQICLGIALQLLKDHSRDFLGSIGLVIDSDPVILFAHVALYGRNGAVRIGDRLTAGQLTDKALSVFGKSYDRRSDPAAFRVCNYCGFAAFHYGNDGVGGT